MVYINSHGEVVDDSRPSPTNVIWKFITFIILFFRSLVGLEDKPNKKNDNIGGSGPISGGFGGGGNGGRPGGGPSNDSKKGPRGFGPRGFKSILDLPPTPSPCSGGACGM